MRIRPSFLLPAVLCLGAALAWAGPQPPQKEMTEANPLLTESTLPRTSRA